MLSVSDITTINPNELQEISEIYIDENLPAKERFRLFFQTIKNPYCFMIDGTPVQISYANNGRTLDEALASYLINLKELDE